MECKLFTWNTDILNDVAHRMILSYLNNKTSLNVYIHLNFMVFNNNFLSIADKNSIFQFFCKARRNQFLAYKYSRILFKIKAINKHDFSFNVLNENTSIKHLTNWRQFHHFDAIEFNKMVYYKLKNKMIIQNPYTRIMIRTPHLHGMLIASVDLDPNPPFLVKEFLRLHCDYAQFYRLFGEMIEEMNWGEHVVEEMRSFTNTQMKTEIKNMLLDFIDYYEFNEDLFDKISVEHLRVFFSDALKIYMCSHYVMTTDLMFNLLGKFKVASEIYPSLFQKVLC